ncbi:hypothetical protein DRN58_04735 [Thermococci archaeon]|nr:MAG: hypothetical protein DRN58_04735 [Thermococci archaeon]
MNEYARLAQNIDLNINHISILVGKWPQIRKNLQKILPFTAIDIQKSTLEFKSITYSSNLVLYNFKLESLLGTKVVWWIVFHWSSLEQILKKNNKFLFLVMEKDQLVQLNKKIQWWGVKKILWGKYDVSTPK